MSVWQFNRPSFISNDGKKGTLSKSSRKFKQTFELNKRLINFFSKYTLQKNSSKGKDFPKNTKDGNMSRLILINTNLFTWHHRVYR